MSPTAIQDYLMKQLTVDRNIITFRLLSRAASIHVNAAKTELASFLTTSRSSPEPVHATYLISGETPARNILIAHQDNEEKEITQETILNTKFLLVPEEELDSAKSQFTRIFSIHVYSLSPSPIRDAALLVTPSQTVRKLDASMTQEQIQKLGVVSASTIEYTVSTTAPMKQSKGNKPELKSETSEATKKAVKGKGIAKPAATASKATKPGTLDWSKAKTKEAKKTDAEPEKKVLPEIDSVSNKKQKEIKQLKGEKLINHPQRISDENKSENDSIAKEPQGQPKVKEEKAPHQSEEKPRRPNKRPSPISLSDEDEVLEPPKSKRRLTLPNENSSIRLKKRLLLSDDEEEGSFTTTVKEKGKARASESDSKSLQAMMDLDDEEVTMAPRPHANTHSSLQSTHSQPRPAPAVPEPLVPADDEMDIDLIDPEPKQTRAKPKKKAKVIPVGKNGFKKRRVVKSRMTTNARGYMVTEDYSSYESVSEEEEEPEKPQKVKKQRATIAAKKLEKEATPEAEEEQHDSVIEEPKSQPAKERPKPQPTKRRESMMKEEESASDGPSKKEKGQTKKSGSKTAHAGNKNLMNYFAKK